MNIYGYSNGSKLLKLKEISIETSIEELKDIILFLNHVKDEHMDRMVNMKYKFPLNTPICSLHLKDWNLKYKNGNGDIIIITQ